MADQVQFDEQNQFGRSFPGTITRTDPWITRFLVGHGMAKDVKSAERIALAIAILAALTAFVIWHVSKPDGAISRQNP